MDEGYKLNAAIETITAQDKEIDRLKSQLKVEAEDGDRQADVIKQLKAEKQDALDKLAEVEAMLLTGGESESYVKMLKAAITARNFWGSPIVPPDNTQAAYQAIIASLNQQAAYTKNLTADAENSTPNP